MLLQFCHSNSEPNQSAPRCSSRFREKWSETDSGCFLVDHKYVCSTSVCTVETATNVCTVGPLLVCEQ